MHRTLITISILGALGACDQLSQQQMYGTLGGAAVGAAVTPHKEVVREN